MMTSRTSDMVLPCQVAGATVAEPILGLRYSPGGMSIPTVIGAWGRAPD